jgi:hypothetical protein
MKFSMSTAHSLDNILISVIVPFGDPRGRVEHLDSWTQQTLAPERFEVIAVANPQSISEAAIRERLRPHDRLLSTHVSYPFPMYSAAADAARGAILFFTEDHCIADPECLEAAARFLEDEAYAGATVRWGHINHTVVARMEQLLNEIDARTWFEADHWNNVRIRGFALRRSVYRELGGFQAEYGEFAEALLAAQLHAQGHRIGFVTEAGVIHVNTHTLDEIRNDAQQYTWGECAYCTTHDEDFCDRYFSASTAFPPARLPAAHTERDLRDLGLVRDEAFRGRGPGRIAAFLLIGEWLYLRTSRIRVWLWRKIIAPFPILTARMRFALWRFNEAAQLRAFKDYWRAIVRAARADYFSRDGTEARPRLPLVPNAQGEIPLSKLHGLYAMETHKGTTLRWTPPVTSLLFTLQPGDYLVEIDTQGLRGSSHRLPLSLLWNGRLLPARELRRSDGRLSFRINRQACDPAGQQRATIVIPAISRIGTREQRRLGLPIVSLHVLPASPEVPG